MYAVRRSAYAVRRPEVHPEHHHVGVAAHGCEALRTYALCLCECVVRRCVDAHVDGPMASMPTRRSVLRQADRGNAAELIEQVVAAGAVGYLVLMPRVLGLRQHLAGSTADAIAAHDRVGYAARPVHPHPHPCSAGAGAHGTPVWIPTSPAPGLLKGATTCAST